MRHPFPDHHDRSRHHNHRDGPAWKLRRGRSARWGRRQRHRQPIRYYRGDDLTSRLLSEVPGNSQLCGQRIR